MWRSIKAGAKVEYGILLATVSVVAITAVTLLGRQTEVTFETVSAAIADPPSPPAAEPPPPPAPPSYTVPKNAQSAAECYNPELIGKVAPAGLSGCGGQLVATRDQLLTAVALNSPGVTAHGKTWQAVSDATNKVFTGQITDFSSIFNGRNEYIGALFTGDISYWDTSSGVTFYRTFLNAAEMNPDVTNWNMSSAEDLSFMFAGVYHFNQNIGNWDVSNVKNFSNMLRGASNGVHTYTNFAQDLRSWDVSAGTDFSEMFSYSLGNFKIQSWKVNPTANMTRFLRDAHGYNENLSTWCFKGPKPEGFDEDTRSWTYVKPRFSQATC